MVLVCPCLGRIERERLGRERELRRLDGAEGRRRTRTHHRDPIGVDAEHVHDVVSNESRRDQHIRRSLRALPPDGVAHPDLFGREERGVVQVLQVPRLIDARVDGELPDLRREVDDHVGTRLDEWRRRRDRPACKPTDSMTQGRRHPAGASGREADERRGGLRRRRDRDKRCRPGEIRQRAASGEQRCPRTRSGRRRRRGCSGRRRDRTHTARRLHSHPGGV